MPVHDRQCRQLQAFYGEWDDTGRFEGLVAGEMRFRQRGKAGPICVPTHKGVAIVTGHCGRLASVLSSNERWRSEEPASAFSHCTKLNDWKALRANVAAIAMAPSRAKPAMTASATSRLSDHVSSGLEPVARLPVPTDVL